MISIKLAVVVAALMGASGSALAQDYLPGNVPRTFYLHRGSTYQSGCWGPCDCPLDEEVPMRGTFILSLISFGDITDFYSVTAIDWRISGVRSQPGERFITGMGNFSAGQSPFATHQFMRLDLSISPATQLWGNVVRFESLFGNRTVAPPVIDIEIANDDDGCPQSLRMHLRATLFRSDWNGDGGVTIQDLFDFLADYFAGRGDHDLSGATNVQDVFAFLGDWFGGA